MKLLVRRLTEQRVTRAHHLRCRPTAARRWRCAYGLRLDAGCAHHAPDVLPGEAGTPSRIGQPGATTDSLDDRLGQLVLAPLDHGFGALERAYGLNERVSHDQQSDRPAVGKPTLATLCKRSFATVQWHGQMVHDQHANQNTTEETQ